MNDVLKFKVPFHLHYRNTLLVNPVRLTWRAIILVFLILAHFSLPLFSFMGKKKALILKKMQQTIQKFNRRDVIFNISIYHTICEYYSKLLHYLLNMCILDPPAKAEYKIQHTYFLHSNYHWLIARSHVSSSHL